MKYLGISRVSEEKYWFHFDEQRALYRAVGASSTKRRIGDNVEIYFGSTCDSINQYIENSPGWDFVRSNIILEMLYDN